MYYYAYQPLTDDFLTGRYKRGQSEVESGFRFDTKNLLGSLQQHQYWNGDSFDALDLILAVTAKDSLTDTAVALRWLRHHSALKTENNDAVIIGVSSTKYLDENLAALETDPLSDDVDEAMTRRGRKQRRETASTGSDSISNWGLSRVCKIEEIVDQILRLKSSRSLFLYSLSLLQSRCRPRRD